jgi:hypothetical protein
MRCDTCHKRLAPEDYERKACRCGAKIKKEYGG